MRAMKRRGFNRTYGYIDDFLLIGSDKEECWRMLNVFLKLLRDLGYFISPAQEIRYLGILINTVDRELKLPANKLEKLHEQLAHFQGRSRANKRQLLSLAGILSHWAKLVWGGGGDGLSLGELLI